MFPSVGRKPVVEGRAGLASGQLGIAPLDYAVNRGVYPELDEGLGKTSPRMTYWKTLEKKTWPRMISLKTSRRST